MEVLPVSDLPTPTGIDWLDNLLGKAKGVLSPDTNSTYGNVLPLAQDQTTGAYRYALPSVERNALMGLLNAPGDISQMFQAPGRVLGGQIDPQTGANLFTKGMLYGLAPDVVAGEGADSAVARTFGGVLSKTAPPRMADYFRSPTDDLLRYEIDDSRADINLQAYRKLQKGDSTSLGDLLDHDELFNAYPELKSLPVEPERNSNVNGSLYTNNSKMTLNPKLSSDQALSTILHETQHGIQNIEGFAGGGNPNQFLSPDFQKNKTSTFSPDNIDNLGDLANTPTVKSALDTVNEGFNTHLKPSDLANQFGFGGIMDKTSSVYDNNYNSLSPEAHQALVDHISQQPEFEPFLDTYQQRKQVDSTKQKAYQSYLNIPGEVEARDVQARQDYDPGMRAVIPPAILKFTKDDVENGLGPSMIEQPGEAMSIGGYHGTPHTFDLEPVQGNPFEGSP